MGSVLAGASGNTVAEAVAFWDVKAVVMVGIAFGVNRKNQRVGDVLVSKTVIPYEVKRVGKGKLVYRSPIPPCGAILLNRFSNGRHWHHPLPRNQKARLIPAQLLSGESLIDNKTYCKKLLSAFEQAEGGEMEGAGVFAAAHQNGLEWILIKGICDFADGKKSHGKKSKQMIAAAAAASLCAHVFSQPGNLDDLGCVDMSTSELQHESGVLRVEEALFEVYDQAYERAYLERSIDGEIKAILSNQDIWITGPTGCGKTNALRRNLCRAGKPFEFIDLSKCIGASVPELFASLHFELAERLGLSITQQQSVNKKQSFHIGEIAKLIESKVANDTYILIDEIPLDGPEFIAFSEGIAALVVTMANRNSHRKPLLVASIGDPKANFHRFHKKLHERMRVLSLPLWSAGEMNSLLNLVSRLLPLHFSRSDKAKIVDAANGCPRSLKIMLKTWCMFRTSPGWSLNRVLSESTCA